MSRVNIAFVFVILDVGMGIVGFGQRLQEPGLPDTITSPMYPEDGRDLQNAVDGARDNPNSPAYQDGLEDKVREMGNKYPDLRPELEQLAGRASRTEASVRKQGKEIKGIKKDVKRLDRRIDAVKVTANAAVKKANEVEKRLGDQLDPKNSQGVEARLKGVENELDPSNTGSSLWNGLAKKFADQKKWMNDQIDDLATVGSVRLFFVLAFIWLAILTFLRVRRPTATATATATTPAPATVPTP